MNNIDTMYKTFLRKGNIKQQGNDFAFWQSQPYEIRLATIEQIRNEYNTWKYPNEKEFQRVYKIVKRK